MNQRTNTVRGRLGEDIAACYLQLAGYEILRRNERHGRLEVDLIIRRGQIVAFAEVRLRSSRKFGRPEETVGYHKRKNLLHAASGIAPRLSLAPTARIRFDVISIDIDCQRLTVRHLPGWFGTQGGLTSLPNP